MKESISDICIATGSKYSKYKCSEYICNCTDSKILIEKCRECKYGKMLIETCSTSKYMMIRHLTDTDSSDDILNDKELSKLENDICSTEKEMIYRDVVKYLYEKYKNSADFGISFIKILMSNHGYKEHDGSDDEIRSIAADNNLTLICRRKRWYIVNDDILVDYLYGNNDKSS